MMNGAIQPRNGLGDLANKLKTKVCKIAYLGASVTAQKEGYRPILNDWFAQNFKKQHIAINAATGGVGSISAVFTMDDLVLRHHPDVCFIEYATGDMDGKTPPDLIGPAIEGIVRKLKQQNCEICFLYLYRTDSSFDDGNSVIAEYEKLADHYGICSINIGRCIEESLRSNQYVMTELFRDPVHTTATGSRLTATLITTALQKIFDTQILDPVKKSPLYDNHFQKTQVVSAIPEMLKGQTNYHKGLHRFYYPFLQIDSTNELGWKFDGSLIGMMYIAGKESGIIEVEGTDEKREYNLWDSFCFYDRFNTVIFKKCFEAGKRIKIRLTEKPIDYSSCRRRIEDPDKIKKDLKIIGFMVKK